MCNQIAPRDSSRDNNDGLCTTCRLSRLGSAQTNTTLRSSLVDLGPRRPVGHFKIGGNQLPGCPPLPIVTSPARARRLTHALDVDHASDRVEKMLGPVARGGVSEQLAWFANANAIPTTKPKRVPKLHIDIQNCVAEVSVWISIMKYGRVGSRTLVI